MNKPPHLRRRRLRQPEPAFGPKTSCAHCALTLHLDLPHDERHDPVLGSIRLHTQCVARWEKRMTRPLF